MPIYIFKHPKKEQYKEVFFHMNDEKVFIDDAQVEWKRVYLNPNCSIDSDIDPMDNVAFINKTGNTKGTYGELLDKSAELSQKRADKYGYDPLKKKYFQEYSKKRNGIKHHLDKD